MRTATPRSIRRRLLATAASLLILTQGGCGKPDVVVEQARAVRSWAATARMAADAWAGGRTPAVYTRQALEASREGLAQASQALAAESLPPDVRPRVDSAVAALERTVGAMRAALDRQAKSDVARSVSQLDADVRAFDGAARLARPAP